jgi:hypothetical protein
VSGVGSSLSWGFVALFCLAAAPVLSTLLIVRHTSAPSRVAFRASEILLIGGFLLYPPVLLVLMRLLRGGYTARYGWPAILGLTLAAAFLMDRFILRSARAALLTALLLVFVIRDAATIVKVSRAAPVSSVAGARWGRLATLTSAIPEIPIVIADGEEFLEMECYAHPDLRDRLINVVDAQTALAQVGYDSVDSANAMFGSFYHLAVEPAAQFLSPDHRGRRFYLFSSHAPRTWLQRDLGARHLLHVTRL